MARGALLLGLAVLLSACGDGSAESGGGRLDVRPVSECPRGFDGTFELVGTFPVQVPGVPFAITGDRVALAEPAGPASYDVRLVGLAGASNPNLDALLLDDVNALPVSGEAADDHAPLQLAAAADGVVTAHGDGGDVVVTRFDRAGHEVWRTVIPTGDYAGEVYDLAVVDDRVHLRSADVATYPGRYGVRELGYSSGELRGDLVEAADLATLDRRLDLLPEQPAYADFGVPGGPAVAVPAELEGLRVNDTTEPPEGLVRCGTVDYWVRGVDLWVLPGDGAVDGAVDPGSLGDPVRVDTVAEVTRHARKGDGAVMGVTPDAVWVGWGDASTGAGAMFALRP
ncbi:hypothetical protein [Nocardioides sp. SYSU DS0651]|uniref:hypothetical protein n=1 Tax=Nocardioides sp. SYSU DS0651 TaxID=3415955 RepID=UPI003F4C0E80